MMFDIRCFIDSTKMLGYYLITKDEMNPVLKWTLILLWDMIGLVVVIYLVY